MEIRDTGFPGFHGFHPDFPHEERESRPTEPREERIPTEGPNATCILQLLRILQDHLIVHFSEAEPLYPQLIEFGLHTLNPTLFLSSHVNCGRSKNNKTACAGFPHREFVVHKYNSLLQLVREDDSL